LARWPKFEESATWLSRVAATFCAAEKLNRAIEYAEKSIELNPNDGFALATLSDCYFLRGETKKAIEPIRKSLTIISDLNHERRLLSLGRLGVCQYMVGDYESSFENWYSVVQEIGSSKSTWLVTQALHNLLRFGKTTEAIRTIHRVLQSNDSSQWFSFYHHLLCRPEIHGYLTRFATQLNQHDLIESIYHHALIYFVQQGYGGYQAALRYYYASFLYYCSSHREREKEISELWQSVLKDQQLNKTNASLDRMIRDKAANSLCQLYVSNALRAKAAGHHEDVLKAEGDLKTLLKQVADQDVAWLCKLKHATWQRINGQQEASKSEIREIILPLFDVLLTEIENTDLPSWPKLITALGAYGDLTNASAAWRFIQQLNLTRTLGVKTPTSTKQNQLETSTTKQEDIESKKPLSSTLFPGTYCDGCGKNFKYGDTNYICNICAGIVSVDFCKDCYESLRGGEMHQNVSCKTHEFMCVSFVFETYPDGKILVGEEYMEVSEWLDQLKNQWI